MYWYSIKLKSQALYRRFTILYILYIFIFLNLKKYFYNFQILYIKKYQIYIRS